MSFFTSTARKALAFTALLLFLVMSTNAYCQDKKIDQNRFNRNLAGAGITYTPYDSMLDISVDQAKVLSAIPKLQRLRLFNTDVTQEDVNKNPITYTLKLAIPFSTAILDNEYKSFNVDDLHVNVYFVVPDNDGKTIKELCFAFDFNKTLYQKLEWNTLTDVNFIKNVPNFTLTDWCHAKLEAEKNNV